MDRAALSSSATIDLLGRLPNRPGRAPPEHQAGADIGRRSDNGASLTFGFLHGQSAYEPESGAWLGYVGLDFKPNSRNRTRLRSQDYVGLLAPILAPLRPASRPGRATPDEERRRRRFARSRGRNGPAPRRPPRLRPQAAGRRVGPGGGHRSPNSASWVSRARPQGAVDVAQNVEPLKGPAPGRIAERGVHRLAQTLSTKLPMRRIESLLVYINRGAGHGHHGPGLSPKPQRRTPFVR